jgi:hypothetical protein
MVDYTLLRLLDLMGRDIVVVVEELEISRDLQIMNRPIFLIDEIVSIKKVWLLRLPKGRGILLVEGERRMFILRGVHRSQLKKQGLWTVFMVIIMLLDLVSRINVLGINAYD